MLKLLPEFINQTGFAVQERLDEKQERLDKKPERLDEKQ